MEKRLRVIMAITLVAILSVGLVTISGCNGDAPDGGGPNVSGLGTITGVSAGSDSDLGIGKPAPDFWFTTDQGESTSLSAFRGKIVLLNFWATWCGPCRSEIPYIQRIYNEWSEEELVMLAINVSEGADDVTSFVQSNSLSFPVLLDSQGQVAARYLVPGLPTTFFMDKQGLIQEVKVGAFQSTAQIESILNQLD